MRVLAFAFCGFTALAAQFQNLTFDNPDLSDATTPTFPGGPMIGSTSKLLPGWTLLIDGNPASSLVVTSFPQSSVTPVSLYNNSPERSLTAYGPYSLIVESFGDNAVEVRLRQQGAVPENATGLWVSSSGLIVGSMNGVKIGEDSPFVGNDNVWDVRSFAGQTVDLEIVFPLGPVGNAAQMDIFGWVVVPEPSTWALGGLGLLAVGMYSRFSPRSA